MRLKADILEIMSNALASATFLRGEPNTVGATARKGTPKTTKTTA